jgi:poly-gamma-glutamate capsule biosynthesis protein CapA/YwtB (metallophosphatase superfamily)
MKSNRKTTNSSKHIRLFLCGDVMTGRGIDQILPHPSEPQLYEPYVRNAKHYVELAEQVNGTIPYPVDYDYIWGDALETLEHMSPDLRIINLETSVTSSNEYWPKGINYRMHPKNIPCITAAGIDCCVLANNHVLDWGYAGLEETLNILHDANIKTAGAGHNTKQANTPAVLEVADKGRVIVFSYATEYSGVLQKNAANENKPGVNLLTDLSNKTIKKISYDVQAIKRSGDIVIASIHWGGNWGYEIPDDQIQFAHQLIDSAGVDIIHGHSSHHVKAIEVYKDKPIIYGCGDFLNDYEGINGYEPYRDDLALMYFVQISPESGQLITLEMVPMEIRRFSSHRATREDTLWLEKILNRENKRFNNHVELSDEKILTLYW